MSVGTEERSKETVKVDGGLISAQGFLAAGIHTGMKRKRKDLGAILCDVECTGAAVYTLNRMQAAPLKVTKDSLATGGVLRAIVINSGIANACTGAQGEEDAYTMRREAAAYFGLPAHQVAVNSTGVIGERLPMETLTKGIGELDPQATPQGAEAFCEAILTTDQTTKQAAYQTKVDGVTVTMGGAAKGSGMIHPNMATMLSMITTDAKIDQPSLKQALKEVTDRTFNCITIDGDTSTNDMVAVMASGLAENDSLTPSHPDWPAFIETFQATCEDLARKIARDGEGASKLIEVEVCGAKDEEEAGIVAKEIVGSDLVKTAMFGKDANWGRIIGAIGQSGADINPACIDISLGPVAVLAKSAPVSFSENEAAAYLEQDTIQIRVHLHTGTGYGKAWGCDLTYDYVRINASYRT